MKTEQELTPLGKAIKRAVEEQAEKLNTIDSNTVRNLAVNYVKQEEYTKTRKTRYAFTFLLPAAALIVIILVISVPYIQKLQHDQVTIHAAQSYIETIIPERSSWIHETLFGTIEKSYIDDYIDTIMESETLYNFF
ncbi:MAG TPA: hypothetical protein P5519_07625 [Spirochaetia bacterium]|nr:hypothetical protein [Spirochaetales bacterium]HPD80789.1 hypothetical protein [Spirochaetales bacterium]HQG39899.1 hypothetical protein [Spirochaetales bacterium]HRS65744.1 hypothetical protein [Spirochaetia bacterium]HRV28656.1 hypothetical protein [Spirochaetia bacterium]